MILQKQMNGPIISLDNEAHIRTATHRRNISNKLQIHTSVGLAIYAIANNLVDLQAVQK